MNITLDYFMKSLIFSFICANSLLYIYYTIFNVKFTKSKIVFFIFSIILTSLLAGYFNFIFNNSTLTYITNILLFFLFSMLFSKYILNLKYMQTLISIMFLYVLIFLNQTLVTSLLFFLGLPYQNEILHLGLYFIKEMTVNLNIFFILSLFYYYKNINKIVIPVDFKIKHSKIFLLNLGINIIFIFISSIFWNEILKFNFGLNIILANIFMMTVFFIYSIINLYNYYRLDKISEELEIQFLHRDKMKEYLHEINLFHDNFSKMIGDLNKKIDHNDCIGIENYVSGIMKNYISINSLQTLMDIKITNAGLLGLISAKIDLATKNGIYLNIRNNSTKEIYEQDTYFICDILGVLIDNAIEAASFTYVKHVSVAIYDGVESIVFKIENSFNQGLEITNIYSKGFSSKGEGRGNGLWYVKKRLEKRCNMYLNTRVEMNNFIQEFIIEKDFIEEKEFELVFENL